MIHCTREFRWLIATLLTLFLAASEATAQPAQWRVEGELGKYFEAETEKLQRASLAEIKTANDWLEQRAARHTQLLEMLGLDPLPEKTPLHATTTGRLESDGFRVENVHFQSRPGLYVTGNLYLPQGDPDTKYPAILYVCGHGGVKQDGVSYGNKVHYQHHGAWFARNGYVCLTIDTLQLGEIEGIHHGTYRYDRWWWVSRGYTPAGVEAWNCIRALDYLESRPEVDPTRFGVTGRSGGGAYSWWAATADPRIQVAVPVAGITDLRDHVVEGCVEGHCDCMYMLNTYRWDYGDVAALVAPRPLLISNTDRDRIFPLRGVVEVYRQTARIYELLGRREDVALQITAGPHKDTQELRIHAFRWFNHYLRGTDELIDTPATKFFTPEQLRVLSEAPADEINTTIDQQFVPRAAGVATQVTSRASLAAKSDQWLADLHRLSFAGWPTEAPASPPQHRQQSVGDIRVDAWRLQPQQHVTTGLLAVTRGTARRVRMIVPEQSVWQEQWLPLWKHTEASDTAAIDAAEMQKWLRENVAEDSVTVVCIPRLYQPFTEPMDERKANQVRRRFYLLGQTLDGMRVWDIRHALRYARGLFPELPISLESRGHAAALTLYASLFEPAPDRLQLRDLSHSQEGGPILMNVLRFMDTPHAVAMAAARGSVRLQVKSVEPWRELRDVAERIELDSLEMATP